MHYRAALIHKAEDGERWEYCAHRHRKIKPAVACAARMHTPGVEWTLVHWSYYLGAMKLTDAERAEMMDEARRLTFKVVRGRRRPQERASPARRGAVSLSRETQHRANLGQV